ncbi:hypothetical protein FCH28_32955 [Streptomyces piniterrae]|uniref:Uncharacterized protein n=1 Tax=Streptomyces piniterrae TaxID=2571125 RepID=A0A4U0MPG8_9ACTN|nr:hypothetical protein [Streptomyces piniterrae]TJZ42717.1 hypothetical protein FCH28_32955 [Streptomyces piniterrae]
MAKVRADRLGRLLLIVATIVLALPTVLHGVRGGVAALTPPALAADSPGHHWEPPPGQRAGHPTFSTDGHPDAAAVHCQQRHGGRSPATASAPVPLSTPLSTSAPVRAVGGRAVSAPLTGRQAVPLSRSGELPVHHSVFRC